jgi:tungstate transport system ATP-binding protein
MSEVLRLTGVRVDRGARTVLDVPDLAVSRGETLVLIGPNGAGKSTLLRVIGLLEAPTAGQLRFRGDPVSSRDGLAVRRRMASVFQAPLLADATVLDNAAMGLRFRGRSPAEAREPAARWLARLGIGHLAGRRARTLSGGEAQRAALARALCVEPELLLLDEPFSALDQPTRESVLDDFGRILAEDRITAVLVTHDRAEAMMLGDRVGVLLAGRLVQVDEAGQVFRAPASEEVARFVGVETIVDGRVTGRRGGQTALEVGGTAIQVAAEAAPGEAVRLCLRPEDVSLFEGAPKPGASTEFNRLAGRVLRLVPAGTWVRVTVDCGFPLMALLTARGVEEMGLGEGKVVTAHFKTTAPHLIRHGKP